MDKQKLVKATRHEVIKVCYQLFGKANRDGEFIFLTIDMKKAKIVVRDDYWSFRVFTGKDWNYIQRQHFVNGANTEALGRIALKNGIIQGG